MVFVSLDRKSTRLNSSHTIISYAVFCLKKKKTTSTPFLIDLHFTHTHSTTSHTCRAARVASLCASCTSCLRLSYATVCWFFFFLMIRRPPSSPPFPSPPLFR